MSPSAGRARPSTSAVAAICSLSLLESTELCRQITGNSVEVVAANEDRPGDIPIYISDCTRLHELTDWRARREPAEILSDIHAWIAEHESALAGVLG